MSLFYEVFSKDPDHIREVPREVVLNCRDEHDYSLLSVAAFLQDFDRLKAIYETCPEPELLYSTSGQALTALHHAAARNDQDILKFLINADAECQARGDSRRLTRMQDYVGHAPLMVAVKNNKHGNVKLLHAADPEFHHPPDPSNRTPLKLSMSDSTMQDMFKLLLEIAPAESKTPIRPKGWTVLHYAASDGAVSSVDDILRCCPDCSQVVDNTGQNFMHIATQCEQVEVMRLCVREKKNIPSSVMNGQDKEGNTPLSIAASTKNEAITECLLGDPRVDVKLGGGTLNLAWAVRRANLQIVKALIAADPGFLDRIETDVLQDSRDRDGESILSKAIQENEVDLCRAICSRCPSLVYRQSRNERTVLHHAALRGDVEMLKFLIQVEKGIQSNTKLLTMVDEQGDTALHIAVSQHNPEAANHLIEAGPGIEYKANNFGKTPLSIAIQEARSHEDNPNTGEVRKLMLQKQPSQCIKKRANGWTILHSTTSDNDLSAVKDIINMCSYCLEMVDNQGMNFLHIAAKSQGIQVVKHVLGSQKVPNHVLNMKDDNGNTPFHIAALSGNESLTRCFLFNSRVDKNTVNNEGQHVLGAINFEYDTKVAGVHDLIDQLDYRDVKEQSDFDLVVGALIATVSFTAGITVPGGYISDGQNKGNAVLSHQVAFMVFVISNTFALLFSLCAVISHYCTRRLLEKQDVLFQLKVATNCTLGALYTMMAAFISGSFSVLANSKQLAIPVCVIGFLFYIFSMWPMLKVTTQKRGRNSRLQTRASALARRTRSGTLSTIRRFETLASP